MRVADRLTEARGALCVGRAREQARILCLLEPGGPAVMVVHGAAGIGKSVLVRAAVARSRRPVVWLDGRQVEPTPDAFLYSVGRELGAPVGDPLEMGDVMAQHGASLLVVDGYERLGLIDDWVRDKLVPVLPAASTTILVSRRPPSAAWRAEAWRALLAEVEVGPMTEGDAAALVARRLPGSAAAGKVLRYGRGHPLALQLAADAFARRVDLDVADGPPPDVVEDLVAVLLDDLSTDVRQVVEDVSLLRRVTMPLLDAVLAASGRETEIAAVWRQLRDLAFVSVAPSGLALDPVVQDAIAARVELADPERARRVRRAAGRAALAEADRAPGWDTTADLMHLAQNLAVVAPFDQISPSVIDDDPVLSHIATDLDRRPLGPDDRALVVRRVLTASAGEAPSNGYGALVVDLKRHYLELRPALARVYALATDQLTSAAVLEPMGFVSIPGVVVVGNREVKVWSLDFGPLSVDGWLARHIEIESPRPAPVSTLAPPGVACPSTLPGDVATLSAREREVLAVLALGLTNRELAERLFISERTANRHLSNIFAKLGVRNRTEAARVAVAAGLVLQP